MQSKLRLISINFGQLLMKKEFIIFFIKPWKAIKLTAVFKRLYPLTRRKTNCIINNKMCCLTYTSESRFLKI